MAMTTRESAHQNTLGKNNKFTNSTGPIVADPITGHEP